MERTRDDPDPDSAARLLLARQALLVEADLRHRGLQCRSERVSLLLKQLTVAVGIAFALGVMAIVVQAARASGVVVEAFDAPPALAAGGISGQTIAGQVQDTLTTIQDTVRTTAAKQSISNNWANEVRVEVPQTGISISELSRILRRYLGHESTLTGALVINADDTLTLSVRGSGIPPRSFSGARAELPQLVTSASEYLFGAFEPRLFAIYLSQRSRWEEQERFTREQVARVDPGLRGPMLYYWAQSLDRTGRMREALYRLHQSVDIKPDEWRTWNLLVSLTRRLEGYERAAQVGADIARVPGSDRPEALLGWSNHNRITQNWTRVVAFYHDDIVRSRGVGSMTVTPYAALAEAEAHRHDWRAVERYIAGADPGDASFEHTRQYLFGLHRLETGRPAEAAAYLRRFHAAWLASDTLARALEFGHCYVGLALGLAGDRAGAETIFAAGDAFPQCRAHRGDMLEAAGDRAGADRAYAHAIALAPSVPYAYQRYGLTLLARDDLARAKAMLALAQARGPAWADPPKALGDIAAREGRWADAVADYRRAQAFAPGWPALATALARAERMAAART